MRDAFTVGTVVRTRCLQVGQRCGGHPALCPNGVRYATADLVDAYRSGRGARHHHRLTKIPEVQVVAVRLEQLRVVVLSVSIVTHAVKQITRRAKHDAEVGVLVVTDAAAAFDITTAD